MPKKTSNVARATTVGATAGGTGAVVLTWGAAELERRYGVPAPVSAALIGSAFGLLARWAAKLNPHD